MPLTFCFDRQCSNLRWNHFQSYGPCKFEAVYKSLPRPHFWCHFCPNSSLILISSYSISPMNTNALMATILRCLRAFAVYLYFTTSRHSALKSKPSIPDKLSGAQLSELVSHWPLLETLRITRLREFTMSPQTLTPMTPSIPALDLIAILYACPILKNVLVNVVIRPDDIDILSATLDGSECFKSLICLSLEHSTARSIDVEPVALSLAQYTPCLAHIHTDGNTVGVLGKGGDSGCL